jgi:cytochrome c556
LKPAILLLAIGAFTLVASADAAPRLKPIMRDWKTQANQAEQILSGAAPYDQAALRQILTGMVSDARDIEAGISGSSANARAVKDRFSQFETDAAAALQAAAARDRARASFQRVAADCRSCHDALKN